eukprot:9724186-Prorocentrum_lima.AAC.1
MPPDRGLRQRKQRKHPAESTGIRSAPYPVAWQGNTGTMKVTCNPPVVMRAFAITFFSILPAPDMAVPANPSTGISCKPIGERRLSY